MKNFAIDSIRSIYTKLKKNPTKQFQFELFGLDVMIDENFKPWLIEINTNPAITTGCQKLENIIPGMMENLFRVVVDPLFPAPEMEKWPLKEK